VELTEVEIAEALTAAKSKKALVLEHEQRAERSRQKNKILFEPFTPKTLVQFCSDFFIERYGKEFDIHENNRKLVEWLALYFTGNPEFERGGFSLQKGILLMGNVGRGKTALMQFFQKNKKGCYAVKSCADIADDYGVYKGEIAQVYSSLIEKAVNDQAFFFQRHIGYCFDDLGTEEIKNDFGNKKNVMADILMAIYNKKQYANFHITTNLSAEEIEQRYGSRIRSRLREMFNTFELPGVDMRK
jgi:hypothetical protein